MAQNERTGGEGLVKPQLVALSGPLNGNALYLTGTEISIGRDPSNVICVDSRSVSRRHCLIVRSEDEILIRDLDSLNGTFVNDVPIKERKLSKGDKIAVGDSVFVVVFDEEETSDRRERIEPDNTTILSLDMVRLSPDDSIYFRRDNLPASISGAPQVTQNLNTLLRFST